MANRIRVNASGGPVRVEEGDTWVDCPLNEEVGTGVTVACSANDPPEMGTMVETNVGVGCAVGCAESGRGGAPRAALH